MSLNFYEIVSGDVLFIKQELPFPLGNHQNLFFARTPNSSKLIPCDFFQEETTINKT
jgi:hypothetical protein